MVYSPVLVFFLGRLGTFPRIALNIQVRLSKRFSPNTTQRKRSLQKHATCSESSLGSKYFSLGTSPGRENAKVERTRSRVVNITAYSHCQYLLLSTHLGELAQPCRTE